MRCACIQFHTPLNLNYVMFFFEFSQSSVGEGILPPLPPNINDGQSLGSRTATQLYIPKGFLSQSQLRQGRGEENYSLTIKLFLNLSHLVVAFFLAWVARCSSLQKRMWYTDSSEHWTCRRRQTVSPTGQQVFPLSAKMNCKPSLSLYLSAFKYFSSDQLGIVFCTQPKISCLNPLITFNRYQMNTDLGIGFCCYFIYFFSSWPLKLGFHKLTPVHLLLTSTCLIAPSHHFHPAGGSLLSV